ncbi:hypothetical protein [Paramaledivibacter caminithermalis]|uniref:Uncharacterized protein n=1 Tax=Paramaledivibacter caminithermalis (strain DSM 15212 / CIP 107654 / DViRD3) TaxID=1121301 RepID=A0A1M6M5V4_PARC5|nr:hypothetical protein [Paramaledivibacter caminithermalis]SHJ78855.1 hypothetical protein SAMN02745912_01071 [Paramaledivibacter caminithermalis DSM 15212]
MYEIQDIIETLEKFIKTFIIKYEYENIGIIKKFRIDSRKNLEIDERKWCRLFLRKSCLNYCCKIILLRVFEDKGKIKSKLNSEGIAVWNKLVKNIKDRYDKLYDIAIIDITNDEDITFLKSVFAESDYDIYEIDKELASIIVHGLSNIDLKDITNEDLKIIFRTLYPLDEREEYGFNDFYKKAPALDYILSLE